MRRIMLVSNFIISILLSSLCFAQNVGRDLQVVSVNVRAGSAEGSGTIFVHEFEGVKLTFILTAFHVVEGLRKVEPIIRDGKEERRVYYNDAEIVQELFQDGRSVGKLSFRARVLCIDAKHDLALLLLRKEGSLFDKSAKLYLSNEIPDVGTAVLHVGSPGGLEVGGSATVTNGVISRVGVIFEEFGADKVLDQITCPVLPGSSGGLVAKADNGEIVGIVVIGLRGASNFSWMVPVRTIRNWLETAGLKWFYDPNSEKPRLSDIRKMEVKEVNPPSSTSTRVMSAPAPILDFPTRRLPDVETVDILIGSVR